MTAIRRLFVEQEFGSHNTLLGSLRKRGDVLADHRGRYAASRSCSSLGHGQPWWLYYKSETPSTASLATGETANLV